MRRGIKYRLEAYSKKYRDVYRVDILQENYFGDVYYKNIGAGGLQFKKQGGVLQPTFLTITIQSDENFEFLQFFQYENRRHPVNFYKNDEKIWSGYIIAESYEEPYVAPPYDVQIVATDGLGLLDRYVFNNSDLEGELATKAYLSRFDVINGCLDKLGISIEYEIAIDLFEANMDTGKSMLHQNYFNSYIFNGKKCNEVLEELLPLGATVTQKNHRWLIRRNYEDAEKTHLLYDTDGNYLGTTTGETALQMGAYSEGGIWPHVSPLLTMEHAWNRVVLKNNYGKRLSFLKNHDFSAFTLRNWTNNTGVNVSIHMDNTGVKYLLIPGYMSDFAHNTVYQSVDVKQSPGFFIFSVKAALLCAVSHWVWIGVSLTDGTNTVWLTEDGWQTSYKLIILNLSPATNMQDLTELKIFANSIPFDGTLKVDLYRPWYNAAEMYEASYEGWDGEMNIVFTEVIVYTSDAQLMAEDGEEEFVIKEDAAEDGGDIEFLPVDVPDVVNADLVYDNASFYESDGYKPTKLWRNNGGDLLSFTDVLKNQLVKYYGKPRQIISGCEWIGSGLHLNAVARHLYNYGRKFYADFGSWDVLRDLWNITWLEIPGTDTEPPGWITEEGIWDDTSSWLDDDRWEDDDINLVEVDVNGLSLHDVSYVFETGDVIASMQGLGILFVNLVSPELPYTIQEGDLIGFRGPNQRSASVTYIHVVRPFVDAAGDELIRVKMNCVP